MTKDELVELYRKSQDEVEKERKCLAEQTIKSIEEAIIRNAKCGYTGAFFSTEGYYYFEHITSFVKQYKKMDGNPKELFKEIKKYFVEKGLKVKVRHKYIYFGWYEREKKGEVE